MLSKAWVELHEMIFLCKTFVICAWRGDRDFLLSVSVGPET